ncbi:hypothetical protein LCGC14_1761330 [marine sediment metagenome]|uniref:Uncharacterized protein n=1 Tax=marine sediment metagenome TaxID=412755 RepID=A0A0F9K0L0_9ZZZZ
MNEPSITVDSTTLDDYGNLWVYPTGGGEPTKIGSKRPQLHPLFQPGVAVALTWDSYLDKPYVKDAKLMSGALPPPVKPVMTQTGTPPPPTPKPPQSPTRVNEAESSKARGVAFSYVTALKVAQIRAGVLTEKELTLEDTLAMIERAELISNYIKGDFIVETK